MKHFPTAPWAVLFCAFSTLLLGGCQQPAEEKKPVASIVVPMCVNDECAVIDQNGSLLVAPDVYSDLYDVPFSNSFIFGDGESWNLASRDGKQVIKAHISDELFILTPGLFGFVRDGKVGVMDEQGNEVQPAIFDAVDVGGDDQFLFVELNGLRGILTAKGEKVSDPLFDALQVSGRMQGNWAMAERDGHSWGYNFETQVLRQLDFDEIVRVADEHMVVKREGVEGVALADAAGNLVVPFGNYWMGYPGAGRVAFKPGYRSDCGYMDYQGKVVIEPAYDNCESFGKAAAMVTLLRTGAGRSKAGMIDREGKWLIKPEYDTAGPAGADMLAHSPGLSHVGVLQNLFLATYGIINLDTGKVLFQPFYAYVGALTPQRFTFAKLESAKKAVTFMGVPDEARTRGMMDAYGKVLIEPGQFIDLALTADKQFVLASEGMGSDSNQALYDLDGKLLVPAKWQQVKVDKAHGVIFGYRVEVQGDETVSTLRAMYRLDGTLVFDTNRLPCGAEQVVDGKGKVLWPVDAQAHCPKPEPVADAA